MCLLTQVFMPLYVVHVLQYRRRSLAYFSAYLAINHLATCFASGHDPSAYGTYTLWNVQFIELYSPFKAHTYDKLNEQTELSATINTKFNFRTHWKGYAHMSLSLRYAQFRTDRIVATAHWHICLPNIPAPHQSKQKSQFLNRQIKKPMRVNNLWFS